MKLQFSTSSVLIATTFVSICFGGILPFWRTLTHLHGTARSALEEAFLQLAWAGPFLVPFVFIAYSLGRRALTWKIVLVFAAAELAAVSLAWNQGLLLRFGPMLHIPIFN